WVWQQVGSVLGEGRNSAVLLGSLMRGSFHRARRAFDANALLISCCNCRSVVEGGYRLCAEKGTPRSGESRSGEGRFPRQRAQQGVLWRSAPAAWAFARRSSPLFSSRGLTGLIMWSCSPAVSERCTSVSWP